MMDSGSVPSADGSNWTRKTVAVWEEWRCGKYRAFKRHYDGVWHLADDKGVVFTDEYLSEVMAHAEQIAKRDEDWFLVEQQDDETPYIVPLDSIDAPFTPTTFSHFTTDEERHTLDHWLDTETTEAKLQPGQCTSCPYMLPSGIERCPLCPEARP